MSIGILNHYRQIRREIGAQPAPAPAPAPAGPSFGIDLGPKPLVGQDAVQLRYPQTWVRQVVEKKLDRQARPEDLKRAKRQIAPVIDRQGSLKQARKAVAEAIEKTAEFKLKHPREWATPIFKQQLKRAPKAKDLAWAEKQLAPVIKKDGSVADGKKVLQGAIKKTPEYKKLHAPKINKSRSEIFIRQPNGWTCGPTSLTMALKAWGLRGNNQKTIDEMIRLTGTSSAYGVPGNASLLANAAEKVGAKASFSASAAPGEVRAALKKGHGVILNGSLGTGGHFIYVAGLAKDGRFIICDPWRPEITRMTDSELNQFANTGPNPRGFAEVWR